MSSSFLSVWLNLLVWIFFFSFFSFWQSCAYPWQTVIYDTSRFRLHAISRADIISISTSLFFSFFFCFVRDIVILNVFKRRALRMWNKIKCWITVTIIPCMMIDVVRIFNNFFFLLRLQKYIQKYIIYVTVIMDVLCILPSFFSVDQSGRRSSIPDTILNSHCIEVTRKYEQRNHTNNKVLFQMNEQISKT